MHSLGCVAFHIGAALNDWIVWIEWLSVGLHWIRVAFGCTLWIGWLSIGLHWMRVAFDMKKHMFTYLLWIAISKPLRNDLPDGLQSTPKQSPKHSQLRVAPGGGQGVKNIKNTRFLTVFGTDPPNT